MDDTDRRRQGRDAIRRVPRSLNLPADLDILSERWNTVVLLGDSGVVAKATTLSHLARRTPARWFQQELTVCANLTRLGAQVQQPFDNTVHIDDETRIAVSLWLLVPGEMGEATEEELVDSLAEIHRLGEQIELDQPWFATITEHFPDVFAAFRDRNLLDPDMTSKVQELYLRHMDKLDSYDLKQSFIHGDAQRKNAIATDTGAVWIDLEECSIGPVAWDLACLAMHGRFDTDRILDRYAETSGDDRIPNKAISTLHELRDLEALTWMIAIQEERDDEFQHATRQMLAAWRTSVG